MPSSQAPINIHETLDGLRFPVAKVQLVAYADDHGASEETMNALMALPIQNYYSVKDVNRALGKISPLPGDENLWPSNADSSLTH